MRNRTAAYILQTIENLEKEVAYLKALVQQAISEEEDDEGGHIIVDATLLDVEEETLSDVAVAEADQVEADQVEADQVEVEDSKPAARPLTRRQQREAGRRKAQEWGRTQAWAKVQRLANAKRS
jgi:hypothetical protein